MKSKLKLLLMLFLCSVSVSAQDVIVKKDGSTVVCRVLEVNSSEIVYKKWTDLNGSNYVMNRADASAINYESGKKESLSEMSSLYAPNNQSDGTQFLNDQALLAMDEAAERVQYDADMLNINITKINTIANILRMTGWIGGAIFAISGVVLIKAGNHQYFGFCKSDETKLGLGLMAVGAAWTTSFLLMANQQKKKAQMLQADAIYQYDFRLSDKSSLSAGIDMINDHSIGKQTLGLGLRYNF